MAWDKLKTIDLISKILATPNTRWDKNATNTIIKAMGLKSASESSVLTKVMSMFASGTRSGFEGDAGGKRLGENLTRAYIKHALKLDDKAMAFATNNLTSKELSKLINKTDQLGALEDLINKKYKKIYEKSIEQRKKIFEKLKEDSFANNKSQLKLTPDEFLSYETFEKLTLESKMKAFVDIKEEYNEKFKTKGRRRQYVRDNAIYNNDYEEKGKDEDDDSVAVDSEELGIFTGVSPRSDSSFEERDYLRQEEESLKTKLKDEYGFTNKDFKRMHNEDDGGTAINKKYGEREIYSAHSQKFQQKDFKQRINRKGEIQAIVNDQSLTRNQKFAKLSMKQAQSFNKSPLKQFIKPTRSQNFAGIGKAAAKGIIKSQIGKGNSAFTDVASLRKQAKKKK